MRLPATPSPPSLLTLDPRHCRSLRHSLRVATFGVAVLVVTLAATLHLRTDAGLFPYPFGDDLVPSYMAGTFVREGRADALMDRAAAERFQADLRRTAGLDPHGRTGMWLNPPFYALLFVPLSALPYRAALWAWFGLNVVMLAASAGLLYRMLPAGRRRPGDAAVVVALLVCSMPGLQALACQQNTFLSLLILTAAATLWRADRPAVAGAVAGLLAFKPQLALIVWAAMACTLGWRAAAGAAATAGALGVVTLVALPGTIADYLHRLPEVLPYLRTDRPYAWERQVTFLGFARLLVQGRVGGESAAVVKVAWPIAAAGVGLVLGIIVFRQRHASRRLPRDPGFRPVRGAWDVAQLRVPPFAHRSHGLETRVTSGASLILTPRHDRLIAATIAAMPLLMPYYMDYDLLLLAVPAVLLAAERCVLGPAAVGGWTIAGWCALFGWLYVNAGVADATGVSLTVPLLAAVGAAMAVRANRDAAGSDQCEVDGSAGATLGRAA